MDGKTFFKFSMYILVRFSMWKVMNTEICCNCCEFKHATTSVLREGWNYKVFTATLNVYKGMSVLHPKWTI